MEVLIRTLELPHTPIKSYASSKPYKTVTNRVSVKYLFLALRRGASVIKELVK
jgi:hypothetical protein